MSLRILSVAFALLLGINSFAKADFLGQWTFETSLPASTGSATIGPIAPEVGTGSAFGVHASSATAFSTPSGNGSAHSFSSNNWAINDYYQFQTSTSGYQAVVVSFDETRSATGPVSFNFQYSTDGSTYNTFASYTVTQITWSPTVADATGNSHFSFDLSSVTGLNDLTTAYFRLTATSAPSGTAGTNRVDNFTISATTPLSPAVPEPTTIALVAVGGLIILGKSARGRVRKV